MSVVGGSPIGRYKNVVENNLGSREMGGEIKGQKGMEENNAFKAQRAKL